MKDFRYMGTTEDYKLYFFPEKQFSYVWAWKPSFAADNKLQWEQGHYFEDIRAALRYKTIDKFSSELAEVPGDAQQELLTNCSYCNKAKKCNHNGAFRRRPKDEGGLGLCENLQPLPVD